MERARCLTCTRPRQHIATRCCCGARDILVAHGGGQPLHTPPPGTHGQAVGYAVQEASQRFRPLDRTGAVGEDEEGGLKHVLGSVGIVQDAATDVEDHRAVAAEECRERLVTAPGEEVGEELFVRGRAGGQAADVLQDRRDGVPQHGAASGEKRVERLTL